VQRKALANIFKIDGNQICSNLTGRALKIPKVDEERQEGNANFE
jgi:hypothetical protein